jgi:diguanylate cyclase (GGDEF)-like protein/PAS domain S-box-containing protein
LAKQISNNFVEDLQSRIAMLEKNIEVLRSNEYFLNEVINKAGDPIFVKDNQSKIILANDAFCKLFNISKALVIGKTLAEKVPINEQEHFLYVDRQVLTDGIKNTCEETLTLDGHATKTIITTKTRYQSEQGEYFLIGVIQDITKRKALENELNKRANTDYLTGINNRGQFITLASKEITRTIRYKNDLSLLMMDVDFFKKINDTYGHTAGDTVLIKLTETCNQHLRENDILGRMGGEEFAILLPQTTIENAVNVGEHLRRLVDELRIFVDGYDKPIKFTVSIGISTLKSDINNLDALLYSADNALYKAKKSGRNHVCI